MDILSMILARNQGGSSECSGKIETKKLTFDGDMSKKIDVLGVSVVKLSNDPIDLNSVTSATVRLYTWHQDLMEEQVTDTVLTKTDYMVNTDAGLYFLTTLEQGESSLIAISAPEDNTDLGVEKGLYVTAIDKSETNNIMHIYVSEIVTEVIHPLPDWAIPQIPAEKLPGAVLPVVELSTVPTAEGTPLTEAEAAAIDALNGKPCIVVFNGVLGNFTSRFEAYASCTIVNGVIAQYETSRLLVLGGQLLLANEDGWVAVIEQ